MAVFMVFVCASAAFAVGFALGGSQAELCDTAFRRSGNPYSIPQEGMEAVNLTEGELWTLLNIS